MSLNLLAWGVYALFCVLAFYLNWHADLFNFSGDLGLLKLVIWLVYVGFLIYSIYCSQRENIIRSVKSMTKLHWGRQICIDLYLGLLLTLLIIFLHEGVFIMALWLLPILAFGNLATLLYFVIHFESIANKLMTLSV